MSESEAKPEIILDEGGNPLNGFRDGKLYAFGYEVKIFSRKPRVRKEGSMSRKDHLPAKKADARQGTGIVGSLMNTEHQGGTQNRKTEDAVAKKEK